jgi:hypothetical protein
MLVKGGPQKGVVANARHRETMLRHVWSAQSGFSKLLFVNSVTHMHFRSTAAEEIDKSGVK